MTVAIVWLAASAALVAFGWLGGAAFALMVLPAVGVAAAVVHAAVAFAAIPLAWAGVRAPWRVPLRVGWVAAVLVAGLALAAAGWLIYFPLLPIALHAREREPLASVATPRGRVEAYVLSSPIGPLAPELIVCSEQSGSRGGSRSATCVTVAEGGEDSGFEHVKLFTEERGVRVEYRQAGRRRTRLIAYEQLQL